MFKYFTIYNGKIVALSRNRPAIRRVIPIDCDGAILSDIMIYLYKYTNKIDKPIIADIKRCGVEIVEYNLPCCLEIFNIHRNYELCTFSELLFAPEVPKKLYYNDYVIEDWKLFTADNAFVNKPITNFSRMYLSNYYYSLSEVIYIIGKGGYVIHNDGKMVKIPCKISGAKRIRFLKDNTDPIYIRKNLS